MSLTILSKICKTLNADFGDIVEYVGICYDIRHAFMGDIDTRTDEVIFLHHSAGKNTGFNLFSFSVSNSETDGWIFMLIAHGNAPFVWLWQQA